MAMITLKEKTSMGDAGETIEVSETRARWMIAHQLAVRTQEENDATTTKSEERSVPDEEEQDDHSSDDADDEDDSDETDESEEVEDGDTLERPDRSAPVKEWAAYARSQGVSREEVRTMTKRTLIERFGV